ncbi:hypothetical protein SAMN05880582_101215 [Rhizobium sp. RU20A]|uniref:integrase n=1 Tax=Rhizobium sp. RU20A TaxID=1907412 RepID=UPI000954D6BB|nr:integrase [Rhizobium sp. RU20A]SIP97111.1 hypothetical protein SAMN05880582_101215 [Rhizobium sp. RU20A]
MAGKLRHWKERNGRYSARIVVPPALRPYLDGRAELEIQLGGDRRAAIRNHAAAVASIQRQIGIAREKHEKATGAQPQPARNPLTAQEIALRDYQAQIDFDAEIRKADHRYARFDVDADEARRFVEGYVGRLSDDQLEELIGDRLTRARLAGNTDAPKGSAEWREIAQALCVSSYEAMAREAERNEGDFTGRPTHPLLANASAPTDDEPEAITFDDVIDQEAARRARGKNAKALPARTIKKYRDDCASFAKWRGDTNALTVTAAEGKSWIEAMQDAGDLQNRTVKVKFQNLRTVLNWGRQNDPTNFFPAGNPLTGIKTPDYTTMPSYLRTFTMDEARLVLLAARKESKPLLRWIPWLCAYSGMRVSEAGNLHKEDFFESDGRWFWKVTTVGNRALKNLSSERRIPVHAALINEGLIDFVKAAPPGRLFKGETKEDVSVQPRMSTWVRTLIPYEKRPELSPNHGWRHLFEDLCRRYRVPEDAQHYMTGRTNGGSQQHYGRSEVMLPGLAAAMDQIEDIPIER